MNKVDEELDFRQQHYPMYLHLRDNNIGLRTPTRPANPIKSRTTKSDEDVDREEFFELHEQHKDALNNFHPSVQSVQ